MQIKRFRFDFSYSMKQNLALFSETYQTLPRKQFQEQWKHWTQETHVNLFHDECEALKKQGFEGDIMDKLYKSARYYFRKKPTQQPAKQRKATKSYIRFTPSIISTMDNHIKNSILQEASQNTCFTLSYQEAYQTYLQTQRTMLVQELKTIRQTYGSLDENIAWKLQKRFRDKFYKYRLEIVDKSPKYI